MIQRFGMSGEEDSFAPGITDDGTTLGAVHFGAQEDLDQVDWNAAGRTRHTEL